MFGWTGPDGQRYPSKGAYYQIKKSREAAAKVAKWRAAGKQQQQQQQPIGASENRHGAQQRGSQQQPVELHQQEQQQQQQQRSDKEKLREKWRKDKQRQRENKRPPSSSQPISASSTPPRPPAQRTVRRKVQQLSEAINAVSADKNFRDRVLVKAARKVGFDVNVLASPTKEQQVVAAVLGSLRDTFNATGAAGGQTRQCLEERDILLAGSLSQTVLDKRLARAASRELGINRGQINAAVARNTAKLANPAASLKRALYRTSSRALSADDVAAVQRFYHENTAPSPSVKDEVYVRELDKDGELGQKRLVRKHFLECSITVLWSKFRDTHPDILIGRTKFFELKPPYVRGASAKVVCRQLRCHQRQCAYPSRRGARGRC